MTARGAGRTVGATETARRPRALIGGLLWLAAVAVGVLPSPLSAQSRYDPSLRFRTLSTPHFDIHYHAGEERLARRLAAISEQVADRMDGELGRPAGRVHVVLVAQSDVSNGWAIPTPYNLIEIDAASPRPSNSIGNTDDWLQLVFTHEYTHIVHLEKSRGFFSTMRRVFGRHPVLLPNIFLPQWQIEGLATYQESAVTGRGRVPATDFRQMLDRAAAAGRLEPLDRASGGLVDWPSGQAPYLYGAYFNQYLADRHGADSLARLANATSGRVPYFGSGAYKQVYGRSLGRLWQEFEEAARPDAGGRSPAVTRLTRHGFTVRAPRYTADGRLFYAISNPHGFPAVMEHTDAGTRRRANGYGTSQISAAGSALVFDQLDRVRNVGLQSDLYRLEDDGQVRRLTDGARAAEPDVAPDGRQIVCVLQDADRRALALLDLTVGSAPRPLVSEELTDYSAPRWSPDGTTIVAERRRLQGPSEIVLVDVASRTVRTLVSTERARNVQPTWLSPDTVVFASDRAGAGFEIYAAETRSGSTRRLLGAGTGANAPAVSPDGTTLVFVGNTADGHDLFSVRLQDVSWADVAPVAEGVERATPNELPASTQSTPYSPARTLAPRFWTPLLASDGGEVIAGAATFGLDALGRHAYSVQAGWSASRARPDWSAAYTYDRWWPALFVDVSDDTDPWRSGDVRTQEVNLGALLPVRRVRWVQSTLAAFHSAVDEVTCPTCAPAVDTRVTRRSARLGAAFSSARAFGYSASFEEGLSVSANLELTRRGLGADGNAEAWSVDVRGYRRAVPRHGVLAARLAAAASSGDPTVRQVFGAGGPGPLPLGFGFGIDAIGLLRGFDEDALVGTRVVVANLDYRVPLADVQRGVGTLPFFLRKIHAAVFVDAGHAWRGAFDSSRVVSSVGAEISADTVLGYALPVTFVSGFAWRRDPSDRHGGFAYFGRIGWAY